MKTFYVYSSFGTARLFIGHLFSRRRITCWLSQRKGKGFGQLTLEKYLIFNQICEDNWRKWDEIKKEEYNLSLGVMADYFNYIADIWQFAIHLSTRSLRGEV